MPLQSSVQHRVVEFYRRLLAGPPASTAAEALVIIESILRAVEDELSGIPEQVPPPVPPVADVRIYPPQPDMIVRHEDGSLTARTQGHMIDLGADGSMIITRVSTGRCELDKPGKNVNG